MQELVQLLALGAFLVGVSAVLVARVPQAWLVRSIVAPVRTRFSDDRDLRLGVVFSPTSGSMLYGLVFVVMLIGSRAPSPLPSAPPHDTVTTSSAVAQIHLADPPHVPVMAHIPRPGR